MIAGFLPSFIRSLTNMILKGVFPVPPIYMFPIHIIGILKEFFVISLIFNFNTKLKKYG